jgi:biotin operon repressor
MKKADVGFFDKNTGEVFDENVPMLVSRRRTAFTGLYGERFMIVAQQALANIASDREITGATTKVFMYLFSKLDFDNYIQVPQVQIARDLEMYKQDVNKAVKILEKKGILLEGPKHGRSKFWRLNPEYGYKGNPKDKVKRDLRTGHLRLV